MPILRPKFSAAGANVLGQKNYLIAVVEVRSRRVGRMRARGERPLICHDLPLAHFSLAIGKLIGITMSYSGFSGGPEKLG